MKTIQVFTLCFLHAFFSLSQASDCINAIEIFDKSTLNVFIVTDTNEIKDMLLLDNCPDQSLNYDFEDQLPSHWLTWTVHKSGTLTFDLSIDADIYDLDFVIYKSENPDLLCESLTPTRCMFSGISIGPDGQIIPDLPCYQSTGLSFFESDLSENSGCSDGQNGYVRYLDVTEGETYVLVIINFSEFEDDIVTIDFCGSALLGEDDFICDPPVNTKNEKVKEIIVNPNPVKDFIRLSNLSYSKNTYTNWSIIDMYGSVYNIEFNNITEFHIDVSHLNRGVYILKFKENGIHKLAKFFKL